MQIHRQEKNKYIDINNNLEICSDECDDFNDFNGA